MVRNWIRAVLVATVGLLAVLVPSGSDAADKWRYRAEVPSTGAGMPTFFIVSVRDWTSDAETKALRASLGQGVAAAKQALWKQDLGYLAISGSLGWPINFAKTYPGANGGQRIVALTDRPIGFGEAYTSSSSTDYPFGIVELNLDAKGSGSGVLVPAARITIDEQGGIKIDPYGQQAQSLVNVRAIK
jgi:hypothetical protein